MAPKQAEAPLDLEQQFEKLNGYINASQHAKAVKQADAILRQSPGDVDALKCKVVALIQQSEYEDALKVLGHTKLQGGMQFERAYCMYRQGAFQQALDALKLVPEEQQDDMLQLRGQLCYRLGQNQACVEAYNQLTQLVKVDSDEVKTNILAAYVAGGQGGEVPGLISRLEIKIKSSFELAYNRACALVATDKLEEAEKALKLAIKQGEEVLYDEEFTEGEVLDELAPLSAQLAYVLGLQGQHKAALERLDPLVSGHLSDPAVGAVAANNWVVDSYASDTQAKGFFSRSIKKLESLLAKSSPSCLALGDGLDTRLSQEQQQLLHLNRALLYLLAGKQESARELAEALQRTYPANASVLALQAVLLARSGKAAEADALLAQLPSSSSSQEGLQPTLLRAQLALEAAAAEQAPAQKAAGLKAALQLLGQLEGELVMAPAVLASRAALLEQLQDAAGAEALVSSALKHWQQQQRAQPGSEEAAAGVGWCLQRLVTMRLAAGAFNEATDMYLQLRKGAAPQDAASASVLAKLLRAASISGDQQALAALQKQLPADASTSAGRGLDPDALEDLSKAVGSMRRKEEALKRKEAQEPEQDDGQARPKKKAKKKKKPRYPKGYDPSLPNGGVPLPDPERWMPKWQRSDYKKKQKRRRDRTETVKGSQGAGKVDEALDRTKVAAAEEQKGASSSKPQLPARQGSKKGGKR